MRSTRRGFFGMVSALAAGLIQPATRGQTTPSPSPSPTRPAPRPELAALARERYGKFLSAEDQKLLEDRLGAMERRGGRLRSFKLENAEEPATDFQVHRRTENR